MTPTARELRLEALIWAVITGDGAQCENLEMSHDDFARLVDDPAHLGNTSYIPLTADIDHVLEMVKVGQEFEARRAK